jgi:hypothetical protein
LINIYSPAFNTWFNGAEGGVIQRVNVGSEGNRTESTIRNAIRIQVDGSNAVIYFKNSTTLQMRYIAGGTTYTQNYTIPDAATFTPAIIWSAANDEFTSYIDGVQNDTDSSLGTWAGNLDSTSTVIGASSTAAGAAWIGNIPDTIVFNSFNGDFANIDTTMSTIHTKLAAGTLTDADLISAFGASGYVWYKLDETPTSNGLVAPVDVAGAGANVPWRQSPGTDSNKAYPVIVPGAELLTNGDFANWTGDDPDDWTVQGESGADPEVSEVGTGQAHGGAGTGACNFYSSATNSLPRILQTVLTVGEWYTIEAVVSNATAGSLVISTPSGAMQFTASTVATHTHTRRADNTTLRIAGANTAPTDMTLDSASAKQLTLSELLYLAEPGDAGAYSRASYTITDDTQAGRAVCWDSQTNPQNGIIAYANLVDNKIYLDKCVAGTWSNVASAAITYSASGQIKVYPVNSARTLWNVEYDGTTEVQGASIADAGIISNTLHGHFMTDNASYAEDEQIWNSQQPQLAGVV